MSGSQALRVLLAGLIAGVLWSLLTSASLLLVGADFLAAVQASARHARADGVLFFAIDLLMGVCAVWVYSAIAPRYGPGLRTAAIAGFSWWLLKSLQSAKWVAPGVRSGRADVPADAGDARYRDLRIGCRCAGL